MKPTLVCVSQRSQTSPARHHTQSDPWLLPLPPDTAWHVCVVVWHASGPAWFGTYRVVVPQQLEDGLDQGDRRDGVVGEPFEVDYEAVGLHLPVTRPIAAPPPAPLGECAFQGVDLASQAGQESRRRGQKTSREGR